MSKESRRRQRQAGRVQPTGPTSPRPDGRSPDAAPPTSRPATGGAPGVAGVSPAARPAAGRIERAGRRDRSRPLAKRSLFQRYRPIILGTAILAVVAVVGAAVISSATEKVYACSNIWEPGPTIPPAEGHSPTPGYVQPDMGQGHVPLGSKIAYTYCPPASGKHVNGPGAGPIPARFYGPDDGVVPNGWVHNLEHGGLVILYRDADADQAALRAVFDAIPASPVCGFEPGGQSPGPVVARFEEMAWPFAALVWGVILPLETLDQQAILDFYATRGEQTNPEDLCPDARASAEPSGSAAPSSSATPSASANPSAAPSAVAPAPPSGSVAPSAPASPGSS